MDPIGRERRRTLVHLGTNQQKRGIRIACSNQRRCLKVLANPLGADQPRDHGDHRSGFQPEFVSKCHSLGGVAGRGHIGFDVDARGEHQFVGSLENHVAVQEVLPVVGVLKHRDLAVSCRATLQSPIEEPHG